jgi:CRISPR-associated exonuclease Cas4
MDHFEHLTGPSVPISAIEHWAYCPRQAALIWVERTFNDDGRTTAGHLAHERVDQGGIDHRPGATVHRSVRVSSDRYGLHGVADAVEVIGENLYPIEFKVGRVPVDGPADLQAVAQALCLEDMTGRPVPVAYVFSAATRRRRSIDVRALSPIVEQLAGDIRAVLRSGLLPDPVEDARCGGCSLRFDCMPTVLAGRRRTIAAWEQLFEVED